MSTEEGNSKGRRLGHQGSARKLKAMQRILQVGKPGTIGKWVSVQAGSYVSERCAQRGKEESKKKKFWEVEMKLRRKGY